MAHFFIAYIPPQHYETVRRILNGHMPNTYDEWGQFHVDKAANLLSKGHTYKEVQIDPDEFSRYCDRNGEQRTLRGLDNFADWKAATDNKA